MRRAEGFTLIELLLVIAISGLLVLSLSPFIRMARERAKEAACENNLRRIGIGLYGYAVDHKGSFPKCESLEGLVRELADSTPAYIDDKRVFICPAKARKMPAGAFRLSGSDIGYMYVSALKATSGGSSPICSDKVMGEELSSQDNHGKRGVNVLFVNGEVRWLTKAPAANWIRD